MGGFRDLGDFTDNFVESNGEVETIFEITQGILGYSGPQ